MAVQSDFDVRLKLSMSDNLMSEVSDCFEEMDAVYLTDFDFKSFCV